MSSTMRIFFLVLVGLVGSLWGLQRWAVGPGSEPASVESVVPVPAAARAEPREQSAPTAKITERSCCAAEPAVAPLPSKSLYQLASTWTDQRGEERRLTEFRGRPWLVAMVFTHCSYACPQLLADVQSIEQGLGEAEREDFRVLLVSMDPERDTPGVLSTYAEDRELDERWTLLCGSATDVRELAAVLGVRYVQQPGGDFSHSNLITLLDRDGCIAHRQEGLNASPELTLSKWLEENSRARTY